MHRPLLVLCTVLLFAVRGAALLPPEPEPPPEDPPVVLPTVLSVVPGAVLHGLGPLVAGDKNLALKLFKWEAAGLGLIAAGGIPLALTGASRLTIAPVTTVVISGVGLFLISGLAGIYASASGGFEPGRAFTILPRLELELGYQGESDPRFAHEHHVFGGVTGRRGGWRFGGLARVAADSNHQAYALSGAYRFFGPATYDDEGDGTFLEAEAVGRYERFGVEQFSMSAGEALVRGRRALGRHAPQLEGAFAEAALGYGLQAFNYPGRGTDTFDLMIAEVAFGVFVGQPGSPVRGEVVGFYSHRRDEAGGVLAASGLIGFFGLRSKFYFSHDWGLNAEVLGGAALVSRISLVRRFGDLR